MLASHHRWLASLMNLLPSADAAQAMPSRGVYGAPRRQVDGQARKCMSHRTQTAPGPNSAHILSSTWAMCSRTSWVPPSGLAMSCTSIQLSWSPNSQVATKLFGGVAALDRPARVALQLVAPAGPQVATGLAGDPPVNLRQTPYVSRVCAGCGSVTALGLRAGRARLRS